jgi:hypothetical protein
LMFDSTDPPLRIIIIVLLIWFAAWWRWAGRS